MSVSIDVIKLTMKNPERLADQDYIDFVNSEIYYRLSYIAPTVDILKNDKRWEEAQLLINDLGDKLINKLDLNLVKTYLKRSAEFTIAKFFKNVMELDYLSLHSSFLTFNNSYLSYLPYMKEYNITWDDLDYTESEIDSKLHEIKIMHFSNVLDKILNECLVSVPDIEDFIDKVKKNGLYKHFEKKLVKFEKSGDIYAGLYQKYLEQVNNHGDKSNQCLMLTVNDLKEAKKSVSVIHSENIDAMIKNLYLEIQRRTQEDLYELEQLDLSDKRFKSWNLHNILQMYFASLDYYNVKGFEGLNFMNKALNRNTINNLMECILNSMVEHAFSGRNIDTDILSKFHWSCWWLTPGEIEVIFIRFLNSLAKKVVSIDNAEATEKFLNIIKYINNNSLDYDFDLTKIGVTLNDVDSVICDERSFVDVFDYLLKQDGLNVDMIEQFRSDQSDFKNQTKEDHFDDNQPEEVVIKKQSFFSKIVNIGKIFSY